MHIFKVSKLKHLKRRLLILRHISQDRCENRLLNGAVVQDTARLSLPPRLGGGGALLDLGCSWLQSLEGGRGSRAHPPLPTLNGWGFPGSSLPAFNNPKDRHSLSNCVCRYPRKRA